MLKDSLILKTKLIVPHIKGTVLMRERPLNLIKKHLDKKLIIVCADAGYGKTTLLAQSCIALNKPFIFYTLEPSDSDLVTFFHYIICGVQQNYSGFGQKLENIINQTRNIEILIGTFINEFVEKISEDFYIILDDFHYLQKNNEIVNALDYLLHHQPRNLHIVIASRTTPPLDLSFYQVKQESLKIGRELLRFTTREIQTLLEEIYELRIPDKEITRIEHHSEGWITAIQLILQEISALGEDKAKETLNGYIASGAEVFDYFAHEVFDNQPQNIKGFLLKTALLEIITPEICQRIFKIRNAKKLLNYLEKKHIFINKVKHMTYKYHHLFKEFLLEYFKEMIGTRELSSLRREIGQYFKEKGNHFLAIDYFLEADEYRKAAIVIKAVSEDLISNGNLSLLNSWIEKIPEMILKKYPELLFAKGKVLQLWGKMDYALQYLTQADTAFKLKKKTKSRVPTLIEKTTILTIRGDMRNALKTIRLATRLLSKSRKASFLNLKAKSLTAAILQAMGELRKAEKYVGHVWQISRKYLYDAKFAELAAWNAFIYSRMGQGHKSLEILEEIINNYKSYSYPLYWMRIIYANAASDAAGIGNTSKAQCYLAKAQELCEKFSDNLTLAHLFGIQGNLLFEEEKLNKAKECYEKILEINRDIKERNLAFDTCLNLSSVYLKMDEIEQAKKFWAEARSLIETKTSSIELIQIKLHEGRILQATGDRKMALRNYKKALSIAKKINATHEEVKIWYKTAKLYLDEGQEKHAVKALQNCLELVQKKRLYTVLLYEGKKDLSVFRFLIKRKINYKYTLSLLKQIGTEAALDLFRDLTEQKRFEIRLFGALELLDPTGKKISVPWRTKNAKSLFCFFITHPGKKVTKDYLIEQFWPNKSLSQAEQSLYTNVYYLRKVFKKILKFNVINHQHSYYFINPQFKYTTDIDKFKKLIKQASKKASFEDMIPTLEEALTFYRDDLLPELYDAWLFEKREYLVKQYTDTLKKIGIYYLKEENYSHGLKFLIEVIKKDRFDEESYQNAMICHSNLGNRKAAIDLYNDLKKLLRQELNLELNSRTIEIYQKYVKM